MAKRTCKVEDCERRHDSNGYCSMHAKRVRRTGSTEATRVIVTGPRGVRRGPRRCTSCETVKSEAEFSDRPSRGPGAKASTCKSCEVDRARRYQQAHPETGKAWAAANRESRAAAQRRWRATPRGQETLRALEARRNPAVAAAKQARRRARQANVIHEKVTIAGVLQRHGRWCGICQQRIKTREPVQIDHIVPLAKGGEHTYANTQPAHRLCNQRKGAKLMDDLGWTPAQLRMPLT